MDPFTLVSRDQIEGGAEFLKRLPESGLVTTGALWAQVEGDAKPYLYILTPNAQTEGQIRANRRVGETLRAYDREVTNPLRRIGPFDMLLVGPDEALGQALLRWYEWHPKDAPSIHSGTMNAPKSVVTVDGAYIYPAAMFAVPAAPTSSA